MGFKVWDRTFHLMHLSLRPLVLNYLMKTKNYFYKILKKILTILNKIPALPFFQTILVVDTRRWLGLRYDIITNLCLLKKHRLIFFNPDITVDIDKSMSTKKHTNKDSLIKKVNKDNYQALTFHKVPIFEVALYCICTELKIFPSEIDFSNPKQLNIILKWYFKSMEIIERMLYYFNHYHIVKIVTLQGYLPEAVAARILANMHRIPIISFENSFNLKKLLWDNISGITVNKNLAKNYFWKYEKNIDKESASRYVNHYLNGIKNNKSNEHKSPSMQLSLQKNKKSILFLGQVYTDSSVLFGISNFTNPIDIIYELANYSKFNDCELIVKLHPKEVNGKDILGNNYNLMTYHKILSYGDLSGIIQSANIIIDQQNKYDTYNLIERADVCVTINSQAGLEALVKRKDVIVCGNAGYGGLGFTFDAQGKDMLIFFLDLKLKQKVSFIDYDKINIFFYIFSELYCIKKNEKEIVNKIIRG